MNTQTKTTKEVHMNTQTKTIMDTLFNYNESVISLSTNDIRNLVYTKKQLNDNYRIVLELGDDVYQIILDSTLETYMFYKFDECDNIFMTSTEVDAFLNGSQTFHDDIAQQFFEMNKYTLICERFLETDDDYVLIGRDFIFGE